MRYFFINSKHGRFKVLIDDQDYDRVMQYNWSISKNGDNYIRVESRIKRKLVRLHRFVLNLKIGDPEVDHKNRNPLDNRKENLRLATRHENQRNVKCSHRPNKTGYIGVYKWFNKFKACISVNDKTVHLGSFETAEDAAKARDVAALKYSGEFAILNFKE